jgi:hypothetical protein
MTITINTKTDLTYEEIYEGHANGKSRLPKILKDIESGTGDFATLANGNTPLGNGVDILRRRTGGGNSTDVSGIGVTVSDPVAKLISKARYDGLLSGYSPSDGQPSENFIDSDVRGVTKNPFDLIDFVSGIDNSDQLKGSGDALATRAAKLKDQGSNVVTRDFTERIAASEEQYDVRAKFGDRVGGGGATGEVHGVDQGIAEIIAADGQVVVTGSNAVGGGYVMAGDTTLGVDVDNEGGQALVYTAATLGLQEAVNETNDRLTNGSAGIDGTSITLRSDKLGADGEVDVTEANTVFGFGVATEVGSTASDAALDSDNTIIDLSGGNFVDRTTRIRYGTFQFGTLRIFTSINDADPVAYIVHPDLLDDLVANNP